MFFYLCIIYFCRLSVDLCMPPSLLATSILHHYFEMIGIRNEGPSTKSALKDSTLIQDSDLAYEIYLVTIPICIYILININITLFSYSKYFSF